MKYLNVGLLVVAIISIVTVGALQVQAAQNGANKPLALYDANGTFLGNLVGFDARTGVTYTSYLSSINGLLEYIVETSGPHLLQAGKDLPVYYSESDCRGTAYYASEATNLELDPNIVIDVNNAGYRVSASTSSINVVSVFTASSCIADAADSSFSYRELIPVSLPYGVIRPKLPFTIQ
jgi:hypothetical protein